MKIFSVYGYYVGVELPRSPRQPRESLRFKRFEKVQPLVHGNLPESSIQLKSVLMTWYHEGRA